MGINDDAILVSCDENTFIKVEEDKTVIVSPCGQGQPGPPGPPGEGVPTWNDTDIYAVDTVVLHEGVLYYALQENANVEPGTNPLVWEAISGGSATETYEQFVFNSSGAQSGNRYNDWQDLMDACHDQAGPILIVLEQTENIPVGNYNWDYITFAGQGIPINSPSPIFMIVDDGVNVSSWKNGGITDGLGLGFLGSSFLVDFSSAVNLFRVGFGSAISCVNNEIFTLNGGALFVFLDNSGMLINGGSEVINVTGASQLLVAPGSTNSGFGNNIFSGDISSGFGAIFVGSSAAAIELDRTDANLTGTMGILLAAKAELTDYDPTGILSSTNVQDALDEIYDLIGGGGGGPGVSPEDFLDKLGQDWKWAIPGSPTTTDYGITTMSGGINSTGVNRRVVTPFIVDAGRLIEGSMPCNYVAGDGHVVLTVYEDNGGSAGNLLAYSDETLIDDSVGRKLFNFSGVNNIFFEEPTLVHVGFVVESTGNQFHWGVSNGGQDASYSDTYSPIPDDPWNVNNNTLDPRDGHVEVFLTLEDPVIELDISAEGVAYDPTYANFVTGAGDPDNGFFVPPEDYDTVQEFVDKLVLGFVSIAGISSERLHRNVPKTAHGFTAPDLTKIIRLQGGSESGSGTYVFSDCTSLENSRTDGMITGIVDINNFNLTMEGYISGGFTGLNGGDVLYLSDVPGEMTLTPPTTPGYVVKPVFLVVGSTRGIFLNNAPSYVIDDVIDGGGA